MKVKFEFKNGQRVKDLVTGIIGIVDMQSIIHTGNIQYSVQPQSKDGENSREDSFWFDEDQLEFIDVAIPKKGKKEYSFKYDNGQNIEDMITGAKGVITRSIIYLNDCVQYNTQGKANSKNEIPKTFCVDENSVILRKGKVKETTSSTGGPTLSSIGERI